MEQEQSSLGRRQRPNRRIGFCGQTARYDSGWALFGAHAAKRLGAFYRHSGLALLVLVTAAIFAAAAWVEPILFGSCAGDRRSEAIFLCCGIPAIVLAGIYFAFLRPRAVLEAYACYARDQMGGSRENTAPGETNEQAAVRQTGVYWWTVLLRLLAFVVFGAAGVVLSRWLGTRESPESWTFALIWTACSVLYWQSRMPLMLALAAAAREPVSGRAALRRGLVLCRRTPYGAINAGFRTLLVTTLPLAGVLALSMWIANGNLLLQYSIAAFLLALLDPPLRLLYAAFDTATYAEATRTRWMVRRRVCRAKRLRTQHDGRKGLDT
jgi:hypothetical protein